MIELLLKICGVLCTLYIRNTANQREAGQLLLFYTVAEGFGFFHNSINFSSNSSLQNFIVKTRHIWRHDLQTESTGSRRSELIGDSCSRCERVDNSTSSWVELSCVAINGPSCHVSSVICQPLHQLWMSYPVLSYNGLNLVLLTALNWWSIIC